jgi:transcription elongation factor GreA
MKKHPMTTAGAQRLKTELQRLKTEDRPAIVRAIAEARSHGDISENAEYDAAKERQGFIEARIRDIESKLAHAHVVDTAHIDAGGKIVFGATVDLEDLGSGEEVSYQIVGDDEADIKAGKVSVSSPIARALIGKHAGDTAEVEAPSGVREYEVLAVRYL